VCKTLIRSYFIQITKAHTFYLPFDPHTFPLFKRYRICVWQHLLFNDSYTEKKVILFQIFLLVFAIDREPFTKKFELRICFDASTGNNTMVKNIDLDCQSSVFWITIVCFAVFSVFWGQQWSKRNRIYSKKVCNLDIE
jgi:hypothetical protein